MDVYSTQVAQPQQSRKPHSFAHATLPTNEARTADKGDRSPSIRLVLRLLFFLLFFRLSFLLLLNAG